MIYISPLTCALKPLCAASVIMWENSHLCIMWHLYKLIIVESLQLFNLIFAEVVISLVLLLPVNWPSLILYLAGLFSSAMFVTIVIRHQVHPPSHLTKSMFPCLDSHHQLLLQQLVDRGIKANILVISTFEDTNCSHLTKSMFPANERVTQTDFGSVHLPRCT